MLTVSARLRPPLYYYNLIPFQESCFWGFPRIEPLFFGLKGLLFKGFFELNLTQKPRGCKRGERIQYLGGFFPFIRGREEKSSKYKPISLNVGCFLVDEKNVFFT